MKSVVSFICCFLFTVIAIGQKTLPDATKAIQIVEVSCGKCQLGLAGNTCDMAIRIDGKAYYTVGATIDNFGDAHAADGMCNTIRKAEVQGGWLKKKFKITYIKLLPEEKKEAGKL